MTCNGCANEFSKDEIDNSGFCYECANYDPDPLPDFDELIRDFISNELLKTTIIARRKKGDSGN